MAKPKTIRYLVYSTYYGSREVSIAWLAPLLNCDPRCLIV